jgi:hypothetical protein
VSQQQLAQLLLELAVPQAGLLHSIRRFCALSPTMIDALTAYRPQPMRSKLMLEPQIRMQRPFQTAAARAIVA